MFRPEFDSLVIKTEDLFEFQNKVLSSSESDSVFNSELQALADKITADGSRLLVSHLKNCRGE